MRRIAELVSTIAEHGSEVLPRGRLELGDLLGDGLRVVEHGGQPLFGFADDESLRPQLPTERGPRRRLLNGLGDPRVYGQGKQNWATQARGQDLGNLLAVVVLVVAPVWYLKGSQGAGLVWLGTLLYLVYAFVVYAVAVHFNYLFLVYVAVLGLSCWAVILHANRLRGGDVQYPSGRPLKVAAGVIMGVGVLFASLWLSELVPALSSGKVPASLTEAGLWVNPIHVLDLSVVLPGFIVAGVAALRRREHGLFWLAPWLVFAALMGSSIIAAMVLMMMMGAASTAPAMVMVSLVVAAR